MYLKAHFRPSDRIYGHVNGVCVFQTLPLQFKITEQWTEAKAKLFLDVDGTTKGRLELDFPHHGGILATGVRPLCARLEELVRMAIGTKRKREPISLNNRNTCQYVSCPEIHRVTSHLSHRVSPESVRLEIHMYSAQNRGTKTSKFCCLYCFQFQFFFCCLICHLKKKPFDHFHHYLL